MKAIVCCDFNWAIGKNGELLYKIKEDLKRFKDLTQGGVVVMGRKTMESLPKGYLPNRTNIVLTRNMDVKDDPTKNIKIVHDTDELFDLLDTLNIEDDKIWVIGGGEIYKLLLPYCDTVELTRVNCFRRDLDECTTIENLTKTFTKQIFVDFFETDKFAFDFFTLKRENL